MTIIEFLHRNNNVLRTPLEWCELLGTTVLDPDGWRDDNKSTDDKICLQSFISRWSRSTTDLGGNSYKLVPKQEFDKLMSVLKGICK